MNRYCPFKASNIKNVNISGQPMHENPFYQCDKHCMWWNELKKQCIAWTIHDMIKKKGK